MGAPVMRWGGLGGVSLSRSYQTYDRRGRLDAVRETVLPISEVRDHLGDRIDAAHYRGEVTVVTKKGATRAVIVPHGWYQRSKNPDQGDTAGFDEAVDWLLNSRWVDQGAIDVFWRISEGEITREQADDLV